MTNAFAWLSNIVEYFWRLMPQLLIVPSTHSGVAFVRGKPRAIKGPCLYLYWPLWTEVTIIPIVRQTLNLPSQVIIAADSAQPIAVAAIVVYEIRDALKALTELHEYDEAIEDLALATVKEKLWGKTLADMRNAGHDEEIKKALTAKVSGFGFTIRKVFISDLAPCLVIKTLSPTPAQYIPTPENLGE